MHPVLGLFLFKPSKGSSAIAKQIVAKQAALGKLSVKDPRRSGVSSPPRCESSPFRAIMHRLGHLSRGMALAMPIVAKKSHPASWNAVDIKSLMFLISSRHGRGLTWAVPPHEHWIADRRASPVPAENIFLFARLVAALSMIVHMFMGLDAWLRARRVRAGVHQLCCWLQREPVSAVVRFIVFTSINIHYRSAVP